MGVVQALRADGRDDPFGVGVGVRGPDRSQDHLGPLRAEDLVEGSDELGVPVADEEPNGGRAIIEVHREVPGLACWVTQTASGRTVEALRCIRLLPSSMNSRT